MKMMKSISVWARSSTRTLAVLSAIALAGSGCGPADENEEMAGASQAAVSQDARSIPSGQGAHCVVYLQADQERVPGTEYHPRRSCFNTFAQAMNAVAHGQVQFPPDFQPADLTKETVGLLSETVLSIDYISLYYGGLPTLTNVGLSGPCGPFLSYSDDYLDDPFWRNNFESTKNYECNNNVFYDYPGYGGSNFNCRGWCYDLTYMNNRAESRRWYWSLF